MNNIYDILFELLRAGLFSATLSEKTKESVKDEETQKKLFNAAKKHDIAHLLAYSLEKCGLLEEETPFQKKCAHEQFMAVYRYENINYELSQICKTLDEAEIPFILLKGSVIRQYYPEPWMRTSSDIDILVKEDVAEHAKNVLVDKLNYMFDKKSPHDYQLFSPSNVHLELHYSLLDEDEPIGITDNELLDTVWENIVSVDGYKHCYKMTNSMFYYYHIIHMAKHIKHGGCGIRPFLDIYILEKNVDYDSSKQELLKKGGFEKIDRIATKLSMVYFNGTEYDELTKTLSDYILFGGVYGNLENRVALYQGFKGGTFKYALSRIFIPYNILKFRYPELEQKRWLFIPYQVRRWFDLLFKGSAKKSFKELKTNQNMPLEKVNSAAKMWEDLGL